MKFTLLYNQAGVHNLSETGLTKPQYVHVQSDVTRHFTCLLINQSCLKACRREVIFTIHYHFLKQNYQVLQKFMS